MEKRSRNTLIIIIIIIIIIISARTLALLWTVESGMVVVCSLLNVPETCECISGTDLLRQFHVLPH